MGSNNRQYPKPNGRAARLAETRNLKMARSAQRYVRGATVQFYEWLESSKRGAVPEGPAIWICGDCHVGNLGPVASGEGKIDIQIRDLDQTVIGNPAHDLIRLGLSLASAARGSDLPGVTTAQMIETMVDSYQSGFAPASEAIAALAQPKAIRRAIRQSAAGTWKTLARERIQDTRPTIPLGKRFWPISKSEKNEINTLFSSEDMRLLATTLRSREDDADVAVVDAAYWMKGCSSLGRLRYAVLLSIDGKESNDRQYCLMDLKEATKAAAPRSKVAKMPIDQSQRVVEGARRLSPHLGERMRAAKLLGKSIFIRELLPQDLKLEIEQFSHEEAMRVAGFLARVVGDAHSRQLDVTTRKHWLTELGRNRSAALEAPNWLWSSIVDLLVSHERAYLEHCRRYALETAERQ